MEGLVEGFFFLFTGVGTAIIVDGTGIYKNLINTKCVFSTRYLDQSYFSLSKCKLTKTVFDKLKK